MRTEWFLALRILRDARMQTLLITSGVGVGVTVIVFLSALISGLQASLIEKTLGAQPHVTLTPAEERARPLLRPGEGAVVRRVETTAQRVRSIDGWQQLVASLDEAPEVAASSPMATGPVFALRGSGSQSVVVMGVDPARMDRVIHLSSDMVDGSLDVGGRGAVLGQALMNNLGLAAGDSLRLQAADGTSELFIVRGVFDLGNRQANETWVLVSLRNGQTLLDLPGGVSRIDLRVLDPYQASELAARLRGRTGIEVDSWMETNADLLVALRSQSSSSALIQVFVVLAVAIGIASVLVVSVIQRSREIGILRAMGVQRRRVLNVFLIQGAIVGVLGSAVGVAGGAALSYAFMNLAGGPGGEALFPVDVSAGLLLMASVVATLTGLVAALLPARRAALLDPATAIRND